MSFLIGGHPRSGTTLLFRLCHDHPQIGITGEFRCFQNLGLPFPSYLAGLDMHRYNSSLSRLLRGKVPYRRRWISGIFLTHFCLFLLLQVGSRPVNVQDVEVVLRRLFRKPLVGDKFPRYVFHLDRLSTIPGLKRVILYRDGRDVVSSYLKMIRSDRSRSRKPKKNSTASQIAENWVDSIRQMDRNRNSLWIIRYEELVRNSAPVLTALSSYLGVDPTGFQPQEIHDHSIGKYRNGLTTAELSEVMEIAGETLMRLGYH